MNIKLLLSTLSVNISPKLFFSLAYFHNRGRFPKLRDSKDISEILIKRVLTGEINKLSFLADKYAVRKYISDKGLEVLLPNLIGVYTNVSQIDFNSLPNRFAIKMNYGAGLNLICNHKDNFNVTSAKSKLNSWLNNPNKYSLSESHYNLIERKIVIEEFIDDGSGTFPTDYKFMCVNGHVCCILVCQGRECHDTYYVPYDLNWNYLPDYDKRKHKTLKWLKKPDNLEDMIKISSILSKGIPFVRVDLYSNGSKIWFGEMTLTPSGCILHGWTRKAIDDLGRLYYQFN